MEEAADVLYSTMFISLDGVVSDPHIWHPRFMSEQSIAMLAEQLDAAEAMLLGRHTFDNFASYWPDQDDAVPLARRTNEMPKFVVTRGPRLVEWANSSMAGADPLAAATEMKRNYERIMVAGGATLVRSLLAASALDEMRFYLDPIVLGRGQRLFDGGLSEVSFQLADRRDLPNGVQYLAYRPGGCPAHG
jgi:dihydrofolate reductase